MKTYRPDWSLYHRYANYRIFSILLVLSALFTVGCGQTSDESLAEAKVAMERQDHRTAEVILKTALQKEGNNYLLRLTLADAYIAQSKYESAEKELSRAIDFGAPVHQITSRRYLIYSETGAHSKLREASEVAITSHGGTPRDIFQKVKALIMAGTYEDGVDFWSNHKSMEEENEFYTQLTSRFVKYVSGEEPDKALTELELLSPNEEQLYDYMDVMRFVYTNNDSPSEVIETLLTQLELRPQHSENRLALISLLIYEERFDEAERYFSPFEESWQRSPFLAKLKSIISFNIGNFDEAYASGKKAMSQGTADEHLLAIMGASSFKNKEYGEAVVYLERLRSLTSLSEPLYHILTGAYLALEKPLLAKKTLESLNNNSSTVEQLKGVANYQLYRKGYYEKLFTTKSGDESDDTPWPLLLVGDVTADKIIEQQWSIDMLDSYGAWLFNTKGKRAHSELKNSLEQLGAKTASGQLQVQAAFLQNQFSLVTDLVTDMPPNYLNEDVAGLFQARVAIKLNEPERALRHLHPMMTSHTTSTAIWQTAFTAAETSDEVDEVASLMLKSAEHQPEDLKLFNFAVRKFSTHNKTTNVLRLFSSYTNRIADGVDYLPYVISLIRANELEEALLFSKFWLEQSPYNEAAVTALATVLEMSGELLEAEDVLSRYLAHFQSQPLTYQLQYITYIRKEGRILIQKPTVTEDSLQSNYYLNYLLATFYNQKEESAKALPHAQRAAEIRNNLHSTLLLGETLEANKKFSAAIHTIRVFSEEHPDNITAKLILANKVENDSPETAIESYKQVLLLDQYNVFALNNLTALLTDNNRLSEARVYVDSLVKHHSDYPPALDTAATWFEKSGDIETAKKMLAEASRLDPSNPLIRAHLTKLTTKPQSP
ncbi:tetratricopeptide repeat protein [Alteromonas sp. ASW11-19]|uniref:Tetratricopeptide repeat protein n=1 Tax=Alteromonas salexigens TaxID=2982530 RepID=A0ABT2VSX1_9ALTE|nr:tetratricopeptide repeat protein [Alteromonas salexigens]MCU7555538.1 tetratricopeptide repeat protein [Alteromonas salexigens]